MKREKIESMHELERPPQIDNRIDLFNRKKTISSDFDLVIFSNNNLLYQNATKGMLLKSEEPDVDEFVQMTQDLRQEQVQREAVRDAYGDLKLKSM